MHGFNRLGGNSVAETVVAGMIVGEYIADFCDKSENDVSIPTGVVRDFLQREQAKLDGILLGSGTEDPGAIRARMQEIMTAKVGIFRRGDGARGRGRRTAEAARSQPEHRRRDRARRASIPNW